MFSISKNRTHTLERLVSGSTNCFTLLTDRLILLFLTYFEVHYLMLVRIKQIVLNQQTEKHNIVFKTDQCHQQC